MSEIETSSCEILARSADRLMRAIIANNPWDVIVSSPYLTPPVALNVIRRASRRFAIIMTTFDVETFLSGGSSLEVVRTLVGDGYDVRGVDGLHAKIVLAGDWLAIGSQNLTHGGTENLEATAFLRDAAVVAQLRQDLQDWLTASYRISLEMVEAMEREVEAMRDLARELARLRAATREADRRVRALRRPNPAQPSDSPQQVLPPEDNPPPAAGPKPEHHPVPRVKPPVEPTIEVPIEPHPPARAPQPPRAIIRESRPVREAVAVRVVRHSGKATLEPRNTGSTTFNLTQWAVGDGAEGLTVQAFDRGVRCLAFAPQTGRLAWPTLYISRLSNFAEWSLADSDVTVKPMNHLVSVHANAAIAREGISGEWSNVRFDLERPDGRTPVSVWGAFTLDGLEIRRVVEPEESPLLPGHLEREAADSDSDTHQALLNALLRRFEHDNSRLGVGADDFCEGLPSNLVLRMRRTGNHVFFTVETPDFDPGAGPAR